MAVFLVASCLRDAFKNIIFPSKSGLNIGVPLGGGFPSPPPPQGRGGPPLGGIGRGMGGWGAKCMGVWVGRIYAVMCAFVRLASIESSETYVWCAARWRVGRA